MDEMTRLHELRADAPLPDRGALAPGRARLLEAAASGGRRFHLSRRLTIAGAAAAVAAALLTTQLVGVPADRGRTAKVAARPMSAAAFLEQAAEVLEQRDPTAEPRDDQWIYLKSVLPGATEERADGDTVQQDPQEQEFWLPYGDTAAERDQGDDDRSMRQMFRIVRDLPDEPGRLLARVRELYPSGKPGDEGYVPETEAQHSFRALGVLFTRALPQSPDGLAKMYRALATLPGITVPERPVRDIAGRPAIAVVHRDAESPFNPGQHDRQLLIDPVTYAYLGDRYVVAEDYVEEPSPGHEPRKRVTGEVLVDRATVRVAVVDEKGQRG